MLDARDVLEDPRRVLGAFCAEIGIAFDEAMLSWPPGSRDTDGVWAKYWYESVHASTGFRPWKPSTESLPAHLESILAACLPHYRRLHERRIH